MRNKAQEQEQHGVKVKIVRHNNESNKAQLVGHDNKSNKAQHKNNKA